MNPAPRSGTRISNVCDRFAAVRYGRWRFAGIAVSSDMKASIANMLGVRREGVTEAAGPLDEAGVISYSGGRTTVLDRAQLELRACECYAVVKKEYDRLLPTTMAA